MNKRVENIIQIIDEDERLISGAETFADQVMRFHRESPPETSLGSLGHALVGGVGLLVVLGSYSVAVVDARDILTGQPLRKPFQEPSPRAILAMNAVGTANRNSSTIRRAARINPNYRLRKPAVRKLRRSASGGI